MYGVRPTITIRRQRGFSLFEVVLVVLLIGVLVSIAIDRMLQLQVASEQISVDQVIGNLNAAVDLQAARLIMDKGLNSVRTLDGSNPMKYTQQSPVNYLGLRYERDAGKLKKGSWFFDPNEGVLVYIVENTDHFKTSLVGVPRIRFRVSIIFDSNHDTESVNSIRGVAIKPLNQYHWIFNQ